MAHIHELIDWTAGVYIVYQNKVLIRKHDKYGFWIHIGGHIELDEHPVEAAIREAKEEVGLDITIPGDTSVPAKNNLPYDGSGREMVLKSPDHLNIHRINETHQHIDLLYYATSHTDQVTPENENDEWLWLTAEEVRDHPEMSENIKRYALGALKALGSEK